ncbi:hypothetical protein [Rhodohalobacter mucosus]|nr:hypothetical protein [Rhodohalobacter mucosus]
MNRRCLIQIAEVLTYLSPERSKTYFNFALDRDTAVPAPDGALSELRIS